MFKLWISIHSTNPVSEADVRQEILWNNRWVTSDGKALLWKGWKRKGINTIDDIVNNEEGRLFSHTEISERYHVRCTFLDALKIRLSIPLHWRSTITANWQPPVDLSSSTGIQVFLPGEESRDVALLSSKAVYSALIVGNGKSSTALNRWLDTVEGQPGLSSVEEWRDICTNSYKTVRETKIQSLQYKIIHWILPCNVYLKQLRGGP